MKKLLCFILVIAILIIASVSAFAASVTVSGSTFSAELFTGSDGVQMISAKELAESQGGSFNYNKDTLVGLIKYNEIEMTYRLDNSVVKINDKYVQAPNGLKIINNRFMVPFDFTTEKLGLAIKNTTYKVVSGDTLWGIAIKYNTTVTQIMQWNNLSTNTIYIGQILIVGQVKIDSFKFNVVTTTGINLRSGPSTSYSIVNYLPTGTQLTIIGKNGSWYKVESLKGNGYVSSSLITISQNINDTASDSSYFDGQIPIDTSNDYVTYIYYTVKAGDNIWSISLNYGIPDYELANANNISATSYLQIGQILKIPVHHIPVKSTLGPQYGELLDWFKEANYVFPIGTVGKFIDMGTGKSFMAKRTMGANHSDTETLTQTDTQIMLDIFGGSWTWDRRPFILEVNGRRLAISVSGMAHAGVDALPYMQTVDNRSGDFGTGPNYDSIKGNGMDGHFDVYFMNCLRHVDNKIDPYHQYRVMVAGGLR